MIKSYQKQKPLRSKKYLCFIRSQPCLICGSTENIQAAHMSLGNSGMGTKPPDSQTIPLCFGCHIVDLHTQGEKTFFGNMDIKFEMIKLLTKYLETKK